jgi:hypothetical protein
VVPVLTTDTAWTEPVATSVERSPTGVSGIVVAVMVFSIRATHCGWTSPEWTVPQIVGAVSDFATPAV